MSNSGIYNLNNGRACNRPASSPNIAAVYHFAAVFYVSPADVGVWEFYWGTDAGYGGAILVDGLPMGGNFGVDYWWGGNINGPGVNTHTRHTSQYIEPTDA